MNIRMISWFWFYFKAYLSVKCERFQTTLFTNTQDVSDLQRNQSWGMFKREISWYHFTGSLQKKTQTQGQDV